MVFYKEERLALFIDGASLYSSARALNLEVDFRKLLREFRDRGRLQRASYYTTIVESDEYSPVRPLVDWLAYNGFNVVTKPAREYTDREGRRRVRGNMNVELAVDLVESAALVDHIVLFAGDGDFRRAVDAAKARGARVTVVSSIKGQPRTIADELRREADVFIDLNDMAELIARPRRDSDSEEQSRADDEYE